MKEAGQTGFVIFTKTDAGDPPQTVYLGNSEGTFTEYQLITAEDQP